MQTQQSRQEQILRETLSHQEQILREILFCAFSMGKTVEKSGGKIPGNNTKTVRKTFDELVQQFFNHEKPNLDYFNMVLEDRLNKKYLIECANCKTEDVFSAMCFYKSDTYYCIPCYKKNTNENAYWTFDSGE